MTVPTRTSDTIRLIPSGGGPSIELSFVEEGPELYLVASDPGATWAHDAIRSPVQVFRTDGQQDLRIATPVSDPVRREQILGRFRQKYGESAWERYFRNRDRVLVLRPTESKIGRSPEEVLTAEFDAVADKYTAGVEQNPFARYLRFRSESQFGSLFRNRDSILELGPGTGIETLELLRTGHRVVAVDVAPRMLDHLRRRAQEAGLSARLETRHGSIGELEEILRDQNPGSFGGVLSTFGALNLEPHLDRLSSVLARLLSPAAPFFAGILNRRALTTFAFLAFAGHPREAIRRLHTPIEATGVLYPLEVRTFSAQEFAAMFRANFGLEEIRSATVLVPPYFSPALYSFSTESGRNSIARLDAKISRSFPFRQVGEYLFLTLRRLGRAGFHQPAPGDLSAP